MIDKYKRKCYRSPSQNFSQNKSTPGALYAWRSTPLQSRVRVPGCAFSCGAPRVLLLVALLAVAATAPHVVAPRRVRVLLSATYCTLLLLLRACLGFSFIFLSFSWLSSEICGSRRHVLTGHCGWECGRGVGESEHWWAGAAVSGKTGCLGGLRLRARWPVTTRLPRGFKQDCQLCLLQVQDYY
jgi:hypothetical protein